MTDLQKLYTTTRLVKNLKHRAALKSMAVDTGIDEGSISRALARANREDDRDARRARKAA